MRSSAFFFLSCVFAAGVSAAEFSPELFPGLVGKSESDIRLAGIAALNPGRLVKGEPKPVKLVVPESRKTRFAELPRGGAYLRLYTLDTEAVLARAGSSELVVDCRYLATTPADTDACAALASALTGAPALVTVKGDHPAVAPLAAPEAREPKSGDFPVLVIVNAGTSGPLEAMLAALQAQGRISLVGAHTAGKTAAYKPLEGHAGWWVSSGEIFPAGGASLVGVGAEPKFPVKVSPEDEFFGWQIVERGAPLASVLAHETLGRTESASSFGAKKPGDAASAKPAEESRGPADAALQRAQDVIAALRVLGGR